MSKSFTIGLGVLGIVALACGSPDAIAPGSEDSPTDQVAEGPSPASESGLSVAVSDVGAIVVDGDGRTLYLFTSDTDGASTCYGQCEESWPPFTQEMLGEPGPSIEGSLLGTTERTDGRLQVTYNGHPIYHYTGDREAGDTNGHGFGGKWFAFTGQGAAVETVIIPNYEY